MKINCKALALDLDGTLTNSKKEITPLTQAAIIKGMGKGIKIILASGRPVLGIEPIAQRLNLYKNGGFIAAYNGGQIIDCHKNKVIFEKLLPFEYYGEICELARKFDVHALTYDQNGVIAESDQARYVIKEAFNNAIPIKKVERLEKVITKPVVKFMIVGEPDKISPTLEFAKREFGGKINVFLSEPYFMELTSPGIEKASALEHLIKYIGVTQEELVAVGDGLNDIPMLEFAGVAVAMENAYDEVKDIADYITLSNEEDGISYFLKKYVF